MLRLLKRIKYKTKPLLYNLTAPFRVLRAHLFCLRYPFMRPVRVWTGETIKWYSFTMYDIIPRGWRKAFGKELLRDYKEEYNKLDKESRKHFYFTQIKEKYGELRMYSSFCLGNLESKYEYESMCYSIAYGDPVRYITTGYWVEYLSEKDIIKGKYNESSYRRLTLEDIPKIVKMGDDNQLVELDAPKDFVKAWGLEEDKGE